MYVCCVQIVNIVQSCGKRCKVQYIVNAQLNGQYLEHLDTQHMYRSKKQILQHGRALYERNSYSIRIVTDLHFTSLVTTPYKLYCSSVLIAVRLMTVV
jgi:hypothetical protein